jgi:C4-dicarboxylate-specific signal transduction histidine kinase
MRRANSLPSTPEQFMAHGALLLLSVAVWSGLGSYSIALNGLNSKESLALIFVNCSILWSTMLMLSPFPLIQRVAVAFTLIPLGTVALAQTSGAYEPMIDGLLLLYLAYLWGASKKQSAEIQKQLLYQELLNSEKDKLQQVADSVPGFVFTIDNKNNVSELSQSNLQRFDYCFAKSSSGVVHILEDSPLAKVVNEFRLSPRLSATQELELGFRSPLVNSKSWHLISMTKGSKQPDNLVVIGIPISELKEAQEMVLIQTAKAEHAARLATLGEMAGGIAHEINNPLAIIMASAAHIERLINQQPPSLEGIQLKASKIVATCQRINKIIQGLRAFSRQGDNDDPYSVVCIAQLLEDTLELCRARFYRFGINIKIDPIPDIKLPIRAVQVSQVILNLLNNSFDAIENLEDKFIEINFKATENYFSILISDSGPGIPEEIATRIFNPFFTTKEIGKGTGLGLSIAKGLIEDHEGELILQREYGTTYFEIRLPFNRTTDDFSSSKAAA